MRAFLVCLSLVLLGIQTSFTQTQRYEVERAQPERPAIRRPQSGSVRNNLHTFRKSEKERMEELIVGTWLLVRYDRQGVIVEQSKVRGFVTFYGGYMSMSLELLALREVIFGANEQTYIQSAVNRYRFSETNFLQTATLMGFTNANRTARVRSAPENYPREYEVTVSEDELVLRRHDGDMLTFRRVEGGDFPQKAVDLLDRTRGRDVTVDDWIDYKNQ